MVHPFFAQNPYLTENTAPVINSALCSTVSLASPFTLKSAESVSIMKTYHSGKSYMYVGLHIKYLFFVRFEPKSPYVLSK
jgi:hypothetical protein